MSLKSLAVKVLERNTEGNRKETMTENHGNFGGEKGVKSFHGNQQEISEVDNLPAHEGTQRILDDLVRRLTQECPDDLTGWLEDNVHDHYQTVRERATTFEGMRVRCLGGEASLSDFRESAEGLRRAYIVGFQFYENAKAIDGAK